MATSRFIDLCRICLYKNGTISLFDAKGHLSIAKRFSSIFSVQIEDRFGFPRDICETCNCKLNDAINLFEKYKESCKLLEKDVENIKVKVENDYTDDTNDNCDPNFDYESVPKSKYVLSVKTESKEIKDVAPTVQKNLTTDPNGKSKTANSNSKSMNCKSKSMKLKGVKLMKKKLEKCAKKDRKGFMCNRDQKVSVKNSKFLEYNTLVSASILEGEFQFNGEQWCLKQCEESITNKQDNRKYKINNIIKNQKKENVIKPPSKVLCEICGESFKNDSIKNHLKRHFEAFKCNICSRVLSDKPCLKRHMSNVHATIKSFKCTLCSSAFGTQNALKSHIKCMHSNIPKVRRKMQCPHCDRQVSNKKSLEVHIRAAHTGERPAVCTICNAQFGDEGYLVIHMRLHTGETPHKCPICGKGFAQLCNMKSHIKYNHRVSQLDNETRIKIDQKYIKLMKP